MPAATVLTPPAPLVTADEAKLWAPVLSGDTNERVAALLGIAQAAIEPPNGWVGRAFGVQTLQIQLGGFPDCEIALPCPPLRGVVSVAYRDADGVERTLPTTAYEPNGIGGSRGCVALRPGQSWPCTAFGAEAVSIQFEAGYAADDPQLLPVKQAIVLAATHLRSLTSRELSLSSRTVEGSGSRTWIVSDAAQKLIESTVERLLMPLRVYA